jgi:putative membrane protein (TIGR04086 family)
MGIKKATAKTVVSLPVGIALGVLISLIVTLLCAAGITQLVTAEKMAASGIDYPVMAVLLLASFLGSRIAAYYTKRLRLQVCLMQGTGYFLALLAATALFFGGQYQGIWASGLSIALGAISAAIIPSFGHGKIKVKNRAYC